MDQGLLWFFFYSRPLPKNQSNHNTAPPLKLVNRQQRFQGIQSGVIRCALQAIASSARDAL
jgi:hypothetical protein